MNVTVRPLNKEDLHYVQAIRVLIEVEVQKRNMALHSEKEIQALIEAECMAAAFQGENLVGVCGVYIWGPDLKEIGSLVVRPTLRRQGLGTSLVKAAIELAQGGTLFSLVGESAISTFSLNGFSAITIGDLHSEKVGVDVWQGCQSSPCPCWEGGRPSVGCKLQPMIYQNEEE